MHSYGLSSGASRVEHSGSGNGAYVYEIKDKGKVLKSEDCSC